MAVPKDMPLKEKLDKMAVYARSIKRAKDALKEYPGPTNALALQRIIRDRDELRATLPKIRLATIDGRII